MKSLRGNVASGREHRPGGANICGIKMAQTTPVSPVNAYVKQNIAAGSLLTQLVPTLEAGIQDAITRAGMELLEFCQKSRLNNVTAESLTAGMIDSSLVNLPVLGNISQVYGGFAVYDSDAKRMFLDVKNPDVYTAQCAREMARGALNHSRAMVAIAVTGHARPNYPEQAAIGRVDIGIGVRTSTDPRKWVIETRRTTFDDFPEGSAYECPSCTRESVGATSSPAGSMARDTSEAFRVIVRQWMWEVDQDVGGCSPRTRCASFLTTGKAGMIIRLMTTLKAILFCHKVLVDLSASVNLAQLRVVPAAPWDGVKSYLDCGEPSFPIRAHHVGAEAAAWGWETPDCPRGKPREPPWELSEKPVDAEAHKYADGEAPQ